MPPRIATANALIPNSVKISRHRDQRRDQNAGDASKYGDIA
jgi:hypothetical protein